MGNQCSGQACCTGEPRDSEVSQSMLDQYMANNYQNQGIVLHKPVQLQGTRGVPARLYSSNDIVKIVHLQACARRFLAQRLIKNVIENPSIYLRPTYSSQYSKYAANYISPTVTEKLAELGDFSWQDPDSEQMIQNSGQQVSWREEVLLPSKVKYTGEWNEAGKRHGRGTQIWPDGARYDGYFQNDHQEGYGRIIHNDGDTYVGYWQNDRSNGTGKYTHIDGAYYSGSWVNDKHDGTGKEVWADGAEFIGQYRNGKKHGKGKFIWPDGSTFEGDFIDNKMEGHGLYKWVDGRIYDGDWLDNMQHG